MTSLATSVKASWQTFLDVYEPLRPERLPVRTNGYTYWRSES